METDRRAAGAEPPAAPSSSGNEDRGSEGGPSGSAGGSPAPDGRSAPGRQAAGAGFAEAAAPGAAAERAGAHGAAPFASGEGAGPEEGPRPEAGAQAGGPPPGGGPDEPAAGEEEEPADTVESLRARLDEARAEAEAERETGLRARAEAENVRRRAARDVEQAHRFGVEGLVSELLPVRDGLELGVKAAQDEGGSVDALLEGTRMTLRMLTAALQKFGAVEIDPEGEAFDPAFHQAMSMQEAEGVEPGMVLQVFQKGCLLHGRVVRPAMVIVSK